MAEEQTAGRGRGGRRWVSPPGGSLYVSVVLRPPPRALPGLVTAAAGVAVAEAIEHLYRLPAGLKWPNDVTIAGRKLSGVLVESVSSGGAIEAVAAGIGVNVDWASEDFPPELADRATSVRAELERRGGTLTGDRVDLLVALLERLPALYRLAVEGAGAELVQRAAARSIVLGRHVTVRLPSGESCEGVARRLLPTGALEVETAAGTRALEAGEVERLVSW